jgi:GPI ethanolamine phosphate transferase 1
MFLAGLFYLAFEETIIKGTGHSISVSGSRIIMGIQVFLPPVSSHHIVHFG